MSRINILKIDKLPYLLTVLFVLIGWGLTHTVDRLLKSPIIEYKIIYKDSQDKSQLLVYEIANISRDKVFRNLQFELLLTDTRKGKFKGDECTLLICPPMNITKEPETGDDTFRFFLEEFHPNWKIGVSLKLSGDNNPTLHFSTIADDGKYRNQPVMLLQSSFETFLVKHEFGIIVILLIAWCFLILIYFYALSKSDRF